MSRTVKSLEGLISLGLRRLFGWIRWRFFNPTREWPARAITRLDFDVDQCRLNGIALDAPWQDLKVFGPADEVAFPLSRKDGPDLSFHAIGLAIESYQGRIVTASVITDGSSRPGGRHKRMRPGALTITGLHLPPYEITKATHEQDLFRLFGMPVETGPIVGEPMHTFAVKRSFVNTYHDPSTGHVREVLVSERGDKNVTQGPGPSA